MVAVVPSSGQKLLDLPEKRLYSSYTFDMTGKVRAGLEAEGIEVRRFLLERRACIPGPHRGLTL